MDEIASLTNRLRSWIADAYELWWTRGADQKHGGFHERLNHDATPTGESRRARLHPRQMFAYSHASRLGWRGEASKAVEHGLRFFLAHYRREDGLFRPLVSPTGEPLSEDVVLYDQAFALLGLASAYATLGDERLRELAADLHDRLRERLAHPSIGFHESLDGSTSLSANSHMHLLEASLAWQDVDADERWRRLTHEVIELATTRLIDPHTGAMRENFGADWQPAQGEEGRIIEPGHQFEWAWLLLRFRSRALDRPSEPDGLGNATAPNTSATLTPGNVSDDRLLLAAQRLIKIGEDHGVDRARHAVIFSLNADLSVRASHARLWSQCERIKAACGALQTTADLRYCSIAVEATQTLMSYFDTPMRGLWRDRLDASGGFIEEPAPASSFYHIVGAVQELTRVAPSASPSHE